MQRLGAPEAPQQELWAFALRSDNSRKKPTWRGYPQGPREGKAWPMTKVGRDSSLGSPHTGCSPHPPTPVWLAKLPESGG